MKSIIKSVIVLLVSCTYTLADSYPSLPPISDDSDREWLLGILKPHGEYLIEIWRAKESLQPKFKEKETAKRLAQIARRVAEHNLSNPEEVWETGFLHMLLVWTQADEAVDVFALYLKHPSGLWQIDAIEKLVDTQNPKAVPYLIEVLHKVEPNMPSAAAEAAWVNSGRPAREKVGDPVTMLGITYQALATLHTKEALAAVDTSLKRMEGKYGKTEECAELLEVLRGVRDLGIRDYQKRQKSLSEKAASNPATTASPTEPSKTSTATPSPPALPRLQMPGPQTIFLIILFAAIGAGMYVLYRRK